MRVLVLGLVVLPVILAGCASGGRPRFDRGTFYAPYDQYRIRPRDGARGTDVGETLVGPDWRARPYARSRYRDDVPSDLHLECVRDGALIMIETVPLLPEIERRDLRYVAEDIVSQIAIEVGRRNTPWGARPVIPPVRALVGGPATVGGAEAFAGAYDFGPGSDGIQLVLVRAPPDRTYHPDEPGRTDGRPTLVLFAVVARAEVFATHVAELDAMLARVDMRPPVDLP